MKPPPAAGDDGGLPKIDSSFRWVVLASGVAGQATMSSLHHGLPALGPVLRTELDLSLVEVGLVLAAANWGTMCMLLVWGMLTDRFGERGVMAFGLAGAGLVLGLGAAQGSLPVLVVALFLAGALSASAIAASGRAAMAWFGRHERGLALGIRQMSVTLGGAMAAILLPAAALVWGLTGALVAQAAALVVGALIAWLGLRAPRISRAEARLDGLPAPHRDGPMWRLSFCAGLFGCAQTAIAAFLVIFLNEYRGWSPVQAAGLLAVVQVLGGIARIAAGRVSDRSGNRLPQMRLHGAVLVATLALTALLVDAPDILIALAIGAAGVLTLSWNGLAFTATAEMAGYAKAGVALGLQGTVMRVVSAGAGVGFGTIAAGLGWPLAFAATAAFPALGVLLMTPLLAEEIRRRPAQRP